MNKNKQIIKVGGTAVALGAAFGIGIPVGKSMQNTSKVPESLLMKTIDAMNENLKAAIAENTTKVEDLDQTIKTPDPNALEKLNSLKEFLKSLYEANKPPLDIYKSINDLSTAITKNSDDLKKGAQEIKNQFSEGIEGMQYQLDLNNLISRTLDEKMNIQFPKLLENIKDDNEANTIRLLLAYVRREEEKKQYLRGIWSSRSIPTLQGENNQNN